MSEFENQEHPRRGRPPSVTQAPAQRPRKPFGTLEQKMVAPERPGYRRYWFNDDPGRVDRAKGAGYEHVLDAKGAPVSMVVGRSDAQKGLQAFLMEIPIEWYEEDMATQQAERDLKMRDIQEGKLGETKGDNRYIPSQGIKVTRR